MRQPTYYSSVFGIIRDDEWKLLMIKRKNSGYQDGYYGLPAGHLELHEHPTAGIIRELREEVGIEVEPWDVELVHVTHLFSPQEDGSDFRVYFGLYFDILHYSGTPHNAESHKSDGIYWVDIHQEKKIQFRDVLEKIESWEMFSEVDYR